MDENSSSEQSEPRGSGVSQDMDRGSNLIVQEIDGLVSSLDSLGRTLPGMMLSLGVLQRTQHKELLRYEAKHALSVKTSADSKTVTMAADAITRYRQLLRDRSAIDGATVLLPETFLVALVSQYDAFLGGLVRALMAGRPEVAKGSSTSLTFAELATFDSIEAAREFVIAAEVEALLRQSHSEQFNGLEEKFGVKLRKDLLEWPDFIELTERRNLFVHARGVVSNQYIKVCRQHNVEAARDTKLGEKLFVDSKYFKNAHRCVFIIGVMLGHVLWRKLLPDYREQADKHLSAVSYELLVSRRYKAAARLLDFACSLPKFQSEEYRRTMVVNRAQAYKWVGDDAKCAEIINREDWSASGDAFQLADAVLRDNVEGAAKIMKRLGDTHELVIRQAYREWPLFRKMRIEELFRRTFQEIFKEPLEQVEVDITQEVGDEGRRSEQAAGEPGEGAEG